jgi:hypothetical protein
VVVARERGSLHAAGRSARHGRAGRRGARTARALRGRRKGCCGYARASQMDGRGEAVRGEHLFATLATRLTARPGGPADLQEDLVGNVVVRGASSRENPGYAIVERRSAVPRVRSWSRSALTLPPARDEGAISSPAAGSPWVLAQADAALLRAPQWNWVIERGDRGLRLAGVPCRRRCARRRAESPRAELRASSVSSMPDGGSKGRVASAPCR